MNELHKYATFSVDLLGTPNKINSTFSIGRARIFYKGMNRNRSIIEGEVAEQLASTIPGTPVIGTFNYETRDFEGHEENPSAFGFIPLDPHAAWVKQDGSEKEYLEVDVVIWDGRFEEAQDILKNEKHLSMELNPQTLKGTFERRGANTYYRINYAEFAGITVLGDGIEPCFEDAQFVTAFSNMVSAYAMYIEEAQKNNEGGKNIMDNIAEIVEPEVTTNPVEEEAVEVVETEAEVTETVETEVPAETTEEEVAAEAEEENAEETEIVETVEETSENTEFASEDKKEDDKEEEDDEEVCPECGKNPCVCENACNKEKDYSALEAELADYKAKYESLENKYNDALSSLNKYTKKEKLEIINKFSTKLESDELIEKLTNEVDERSLDEIKNELGQALVEQLSAEEETETTDTDSNFSLNINIADNNLGNSAWDLVKRHKANK
jgi:hypothetical protein